MIVASPIFTAAVSGLFKSFIDVLGPATVQDKPMVLAATGGSPRHGTILDYAMCPVFSYLRARFMPPRSLAYRGLGTALG